MTTALVRVEAPHFVAGLIFDGERCVDAAPILARAIGKSRSTLRYTFYSKGWIANIIEQDFIYSKRG